MSPQNTQLARCKSLESLPKCRPEQGAICLVLHVKIKKLKLVSNTWTYQLYRAHRDRKQGNPNCNNKPGKIYSNKSQNLGQNLRETNPWIKNRLHTNTRKNSHGSELPWLWPIRNNLTSTWPRSWLHQPTNKPKLRPKLSNIDQMNKKIRTNRMPAFWDTPRRPIITHTSDSHQIPIQNKTKSKVQN